MAPNYGDPDNFRRANIILQSTITSCTTVALGIRLYTRVIIKNHFGIDDALAVLSWALVMELSLVLAVAIRWGFGTHIYDIPAADLRKAVKLLEVARKSYFPVVLTVKVCILTGYLRIFNIDRTTKWALWAGLCLITLFYIAAFFVDITHCKVPVGCEPFLMGTGIFNVISDFYILLLPMPLIFRMRMPITRRLRIVSVFALGSITCVASIMRLTSIRYAADPDQTYVAAKVMHWNVVETNIGLICACASAFPAFFDPSAPRSLGFFVRRLFSRKNKSHDKPGARNNDVSDEVSNTKWIVLPEVSRERLHNQDIDEI
ncbi:unnamed protein product [Periconia digitata]|uniref:Rhodopsin domain-containing protein n=1 Tax=Periconia digitata TaxID=1303443 RepID=A0A9W4U4X7_9PLEO|nr:unnamed protein product [Periconia digitata]